MNIARVMICCTLLLGTSWFTQPASAQDLPGVANVSQTGGLGISNPWGSRYGTRSDIGDGRGWDSGYQTLFIRQPFSIVPEEWVVFGEARGFVPYTGNFGANLGGGIRYFDWNSGYVFGGSFWYDHDVSSIKDFSNAFNYNQFGFSAEALGPVWDFRANAYLPIDSDPNVLARELQGLGFSGFSLVCVFQQQTEQALAGGDFEVGGNVIEGLANFGIRPYVGAYYYEAEEADQAVGFKARLEALVTQDFALEGQVTHDGMFGTHVTMGATWTFGSGQSPRWFTRQRQVDRLYAQVERNYRLTLFRELQTVNEQSIDPNTGDPILVFHIDNTAAAGGNGTAEAPLNFLPESVPGNFDIIFVHRGDGTNNAQTGGINLFDLQRLLGEGALHLVNTDCGLLPLPGTEGPFPTISNFAGSAVTLANGNEVAGFNITDSLDAGISGTNITDFTLRDLNIVNNNRGIVLTNASGIGSMQNLFLNTNPLGGVVINNTAAPLLTVDMQSVNVQNSFLGPGIEITGDDSDIIASITNSSATTSQAGLHVSGINTSNITVNSSSNNFSGNVGDGVLTGVGASLQSNDSTVVFNSLNDIFDANDAHGITASVSNFGVLDANFFGLSRVNSNGLNGFNGNVDNGTLNLAVLAGNTFNANGQSGIQVALTNGSVLNLGFDGSFATDNGGHGIGVLADASTINASISNSTLNNNGLSGISFDIQNGSILNAFLINNIETISDNGQHGVLARATNSTINEFHILTNVIAGNALSGVQIELINSNIVNNIIQGNLIAANGSFGVVYFSDTGIIQNATIGGLQAVEGNIIQGNGDAGIAFFGSGAPLAPSNFLIANNNITDTVAGPNVAANGEGVFFNLRNVGTLNVQLDRNFIAGNASHGAQFTQIDASILNAQVTNNTIGSPVAFNPAFSNGADGIHFERQGNAQVTATITGNLINQNDEDGIEIFAQGGGLTPLTFNIHDNIITFNDGRGVVYGVQVNSDVLANMDRNQINDNGNDGVAHNNLQDGRLRGTWSDNTIARNNGTGIDLDGNAGDPFNDLGINIVRATIVDNADNGVSITNNAGAGTLVDIVDSTIARNEDFGIVNSNVGNFGATDNLNVTNVTIEQNGQTGVELINDNESAMTVVIDDSRIRFNGAGLVTGHGIRFLNQELLANSVIGGTDGSLTVTDTIIQGNTDDGVLVINHTDEFLTDNDMLVVFQRNQVIGNGSVALGSIGGLILATGTSSGGTLFADVDTNSFSGNFGDDFVTVAYRGQAADPADTIADPLARMQLQFRNNVGESLSVLNFNTGFTIDGVTFSANDQTFFDNASDVKSPAPPFSVNTRRRNAVRNVAGFPGLGDSTFDVEDDVLLSNAFPDILEFLGIVGIGGTNPPGELDYEWDLVPVGTLFP